MQKASRPPQDRTMVVACLAEVAQNMGAPIAGYVDVIFPFFAFVVFCLCRMLLTLVVPEYFLNVSEGHALGAQRTGVIRSNQ